MSDKSYAGLRMDALRLLDACVGKPSTSYHRKARNRQAHTSLIDGPHDASTLPVQWSVVRRRRKEGVDHVK